MLKTEPQESEMTNSGLWLSLVERFVRDEEVVGSNPASPTTTPARTSVL